MNGNFALGEPAASLYHLAASGDLTAQRFMVTQCLDARDHAERDGGQADLASFELLLWARLAAAHGDDTDIMKLGSALIYVSRTLGLSGRTAVAHNLYSEATALIRTLAAKGNRVAEQAMHQMIVEAPASVIQRSTAIMEAANAQANSVA